VVQPFRISSLKIMVAWRRAQRTSATWDSETRCEPLPHRAVPSMHGFRHTAASRVLLAGESVDEVAFLLGQNSANVTRDAYVREVASARRRAMRRSRMAAEYSAVPDASVGGGAPGRRESEPLVRIA
jgi:integrase